MKPHPALLTRLPFAHRGLFSNENGVPENSLAAFAAAKAAGFGIEMDVALTDDGEVVVFHDDKFDRLCSVGGAVKNLPWFAMRDFQLLGTNERIPLLTEVLNFVGGAVPLMIELKSFDLESGFHESGDLEKKVLKILENYPGEYAFKSFNPGTVTRLQQAGAKGPVGFLSCNYKRDGDFGFLNSETAQAHSELSSEVAQKADFISYNIHDLTTAHRTTLTEAATEFKTSPKPVLVWTVRTPEDFAKAQLLADNIVFELRGVEARPFKPKAS